MADWRDPAFMQRAGALVSSHQRERLFKIYSEPFYLLSTDTEPYNGALCRFLVSGSTQQTYAVNLNLKQAPSSGPGSFEFSCTCRDAAFGCKRNKCVCKHVCFVVYRVLKHADLDFLVTRVLSREVAEALAAKARSEAGQAGDADRQLNAMFTVVALDGGDGSKDVECPICYDLLFGAADAQEQALRCPRCHNMVHAACMRKWLSSGSKTCVYCRSDAWADFKLLPP
jgi:hypothetical protein